MRSGTNWSIALAIENPSCVNLTGGACGKEMSWRVNGQIASTDRRLVRDRECFEGGI
jgi:hypothetical protein